MGVLLLGDIGRESIDELLRRFGLELELAPADAPIPGSFWGAPEAGIIDRRVIARPDTPIHSILHEAAHLICMCAERRRSLKGNAGSDDCEESAVCYLQVILSDYLTGVGRERLMNDMDAWGYSFRYGSTAAWFQDDATDAIEWLVSHGLLDGDSVPTWILRE